MAKKPKAFGLNMAHSRMDGINPAMGKETVNKPSNNKHKAFADAIMKKRGKK